jgi:hypothetical protein
MANVEEDFAARQGPRSNRPVIVLCILHKIKAKFGYIKILEKRAVEPCGYWRESGVSSTQCKAQRKRSLLGHEDLARYESGQDAAALILAERRSSAGTMHDERLQQELTSTETFEEGQVR